MVGAIAGIRSDWDAERGKQVMRDEALIFAVWLFVTIVQVGAATRGIVLRYPICSKR